MNNRELILHDNLPEALRLLRVFHSMKQNFLADNLNISRSYISEIEKGTRTPSLDVIKQYAAFFKIPVSSIMFFSEQIAISKQDDQCITFKTRYAISSKIINFLQFIEQNK